MKALTLTFLLFNSITFAEEVKTKDLKNESLNSNNSATTNPNATISPEQAAELQTQIKALKENQEKANKLIDELDKEQ